MLFLIEIACCNKHKTINIAKARGP